MSVHVELVSPEQMLYSGDAEMIVARTTEGDIAFLPGHAPFLGSLGIGVVRIILDGDNEEVAAIHGGFVEVRGGNVIVLTDVAEMSGDIDVERATAARERAQQAMDSEPTAEVEAALARATTRLVAAGAADEASLS
ncbi:MAG: ATP synthase F1 subunit epsilon [Acidimicrobiia bacterium]|nr:ATP synthase F1 subunit epsilon [Acidimicrobiia bacterium]